MYRYSQVHATYVIRSPVCRTNIASANSVTSLFRFRVNSDVSDPDIAITTSVTHTYIYVYGSSVFQKPSACDWHVETVLHSSNTSYIDPNT
jgi:hypothetical protein